MVRGRVGPLRVLKDGAVTVTLELAADQASAALALRGQEVEIAPPAGEAGDVAAQAAIDDIMAGKPPRPPKDWTPRNPSVGGGSSGGTPAVKPDPAPTAA